MLVKLQELGQECLRFKGNQVAARKKAEEPKWEAQALRLTVFLAEPFPSDASVWKMLIGEDPESDDYRPREGQRRQVGPWHECSLEVLITNSRIDIVAAPQLVPGKPAMTIGEFELCLERYVNLIRPWLKTSSIKCTRIAVGAILLSATTSREASYRLLGNLVPSVKYDTKNSREPLYRINRPKKSAALKGETLNRVTTWGSILARQAVFNEGGVTFQKVEQSYARLECDNSTAAERVDAIPVNDLVKAFNELATLIVENATAGEIA